MIIVVNFCEGAEQWYYGEISEKQVNCLLFFFLPINKFSISLIQHSTILKFPRKKKHIKKTELHIIYIELWIYINKVTVHSVSMLKKKCKYIEIWHTWAHYHCTRLILEVGIGTLSTTKIWRRVVTDTRARASSVLTRDRTVSPRGPQTPGTAYWNEKCVMLQNK